MPKKPRNSELLIARLTDGERAPAPLSEKLIAKLHGAVEAARRNRVPRSAHAARSDDDSPRTRGALHEFRSVLDAAQGHPPDEEPR